jgi:hypothetical protein
MKVRTTVARTHPLALLIRHRHVVHSLHSRYIFTVSRTSHVPLWARCDDSDRENEEEVVDVHFIAFIMQVLHAWSPYF